MTLSLQKILKKCKNIDIKFSFKIYSHPDFMYIIYIQILLNFISSNIHIYIFFQFYTINKYIQIDKLNLLQILGLFYLVREAHIIYT